MLLNLRRAFRGSGRLTKQSLARRRQSSAEVLESRLLLAAAIGVDSRSAAAAANHAPSAQDDAFTIDEDTTLVVNVAPITRLHLESESGDWIGQGRTWNYTRGNAAFDIGKNYDNGVTVRVTEFGTSGSSWGTYFAAPNEALLTPGHYSGAMRWPFQSAGRPGLDVSGDGRGSNALTGNFTVHELVWDTSHAHVIRFAASFEQHSEGKPPALTGIVQYNSLYGVQSGGVLKNDSDPDGDPLRSLIMSAPVHGTVALNDRGALIYTPDVNFSGVDSFTYVATDGELVSNAATVTVTVRAVNDVPLVKEETITTPEDHAVWGTITATDADHPGLVFTVQDGPSHGLLKLGPAGYYVYRPDANFHGSDTFRVRATNSEGAFDIGTITVSVTPVNDSPVAHDDHFTIDDRSSLVVSAAPATVLHMESEAGDWIGQGRTWDNSLADATFNVTGSANAVHISVIEPDWGSWWYLDFAAPAGTVMSRGRYTAAMRASSGDDRYPGLEISGNGRGSNTLTGEFTVHEFVWNAATKKIERLAISFEQHSEGKAPALTGYVRYKSLYEAESPVLFNDRDVEQSPLQPIVVTGPQHGTLVRDAAGTLKYLPNPGFIGRDSFTYRLTDGERRSNVATATVDVSDFVPDPMGVDDVFTVAEQGSLSGNVLTNDINHFSGPLTVTAVNGVHGAAEWVTLDSGALVWVFENGDFYYSPRSAFMSLAVDETASDEFSYELTDANGGHRNRNGPHHPATELKTSLASTAAAGTWRSPTGVPSTRQHGPAGRMPIGMLCGMATSMATGVAMSSGCSTERGLLAFPPARVLQPLCGRNGRTSFGETYWSRTSITTAATTSSLATAGTGGCHCLTAQCFAFPLFGQRGLTCRGIILPSAQ